MHERHRFLFSRGLCVLPKLVTLPRATSQRVCIERASLDGEVVAGRRDAFEVRDARGFYSHEGLRVHIVEKIRPSSAEGAKGFRQFAS